MNSSENNESNEKKLYDAITEYKDHGYKFEVIKELIKSFEQSGNETPTITFVLANRSSNDIRIDNKVFGFRIDLLYAAFETITSKLDRYISEYEYIVKQGKVKFKFTRRIFSSRNVETEKTYIKNKFITLYKFFTILMNLQVTRYKINLENAKDMRSRITTREEWNDKLNEETTSPAVGYFILDTKDADEYYKITYPDITPEKLEEKRVEYEKFKEVLERGSTSGGRRTKRRKNKRKKTKRRKHKKK
jgi:hypothetical protein